MNLADVLKVLVERLPADWDELKKDAHAAIDGHFADQAPAPAAEGAGAPAAAETPSTETPPA